MQMSEPLIPVQNPPNHTIFILWFVPEGTPSRPEKTNTEEEEEWVLPPPHPELPEGVLLALGVLRTFQAPPLPWVPQVHALWLPWA